MNQEEQPVNAQTPFEIIENSESVVIVCDGHEIDGCFLKPIIANIRELSSNIPVSIEPVIVEPDLAWFCKIELPNNEPLSNHSEINGDFVRELIAARILAHGPIPITKYVKSYMVRLDNNKIYGHVVDVVTIDGVLRFDICYDKATVSKSYETKCMHLVARLGAMAMHSSTSAYSFYVEEIQFDEERTIAHLLSNNHK